MVDMSESVQFDEIYYYDLMRIGITVPVSICLGDETEEFEAKVDTGSTYCVFRNVHGRALGLEIDTGISVMIGTPTSSFRAYGHELSLSVLGVDTVSTVYFAESDHFDRNVLGRIGFLDRVKLGLIEPEGKLYLSRYQR